MPVDEDLRVLDSKLKQLKLDYERYFLGSRPREPRQLRAEVQKLVTVYANQPIQNTALRFQFSSICSRFQAFKRQWNDTLRKIDEGSYSRHRFKATLRERERSTTAAPPPDASGSTSSDGHELFDAYVAARRRCGQDVRNLSPEKLDAILSEQRELLRKRHGTADFRFKVVVEDGRAKLKASRGK